MGKIFLAVAVASLAVGLIGHNNDIVDGLGQALVGVFLILVLIRKLFVETEHAENLAHATSGQPKHE